MTSKTKRGAISRKAIQCHHISYEPEIKVKIFQKEHYWITIAERFNPISKGFIKCLREYIKKIRIERLSYEKIPTI